MKKSKPIMAAAAFAAALAAGMFMPAPFAWACVFFFLSVFFGLLMASSSRNGVKNLCLSLLAVMVALCAAELYLGTAHAIKESKREEKTSRATPEPPAVERPANDGLTPLGEYYLRDDPAVGYGPRPAQTRMRARSVCDGNVVYDVIYSTLPSGWRVTPQHPEADTAVVVFGCSFTFGEGLADKDTFPWKLGELLGERYQVFNFGFQGYGSHHMLAWIEKGILEDIAKRYKKMYVFYSTIRGHELRSMGYSQWDAYGPWYGFENDRIVRKGVFADRVSPLTPYLDAVFGKSMLYCKAADAKFFPRWFRFKHHAGIVAEADRRVRECCGAKLTAVLWPRVLFSEALAEQGVETLDLAPLMPDYEKDQEKYALHKCDGHPNALATDIVAKALAGHIQEHP